MHLKDEIDSLDAKIYIVIQWRIQDFPGGVISKLLYCKYFAKNCMKMKYFGPWVGGAYLDPPMLCMHPNVLCVQYLQFLKSVSVGYQCFQMHIGIIT